MTELVRTIDPDLLESVGSIRQDLHRTAELGFAERETAAILSEQLARLPLDHVRTGVGGTGIVATLNGREPGKVIAIRAEMDGLPIQEMTGLPWASLNPGQMHACGHDGHMAINLGLVRWFSERRQDWPGTLKFIFQPSEEDGAGARKVVEAGVLSDPDVDYVLGAHARPQLQPGQIELDDIPSAAADGFDLMVEALGCHGAYPHLGRDALLIASHIVVNLQGIVSRQVAPNQAAVVSVGALKSGQARNVIAERATLLGTIRTRDLEVRRQVLDSVERIAKSTAESLGGQASMKLRAGYPRVHNDPRLLDLFRRLGWDLLGRQNVLEAKDATMGADDFSYYLSEQGGVPGCIIRLGIECDSPLHSDRFDFGSQAIEPGMLMLANMALVLLRGEGGL